MPSFDTLLDHLAARDAAPAASPEAAPAATPETARVRGTSRIIASERLHRYTPFAMGTLSPAPGEIPPHQPAPAPTAVPAPAEGPDYADGHRSGLAEGFRRGFEAGSAHARAEHEERERQAGAALAERLAVLVEDCRRRLDAIERDAADAVVDLALEVARHALRATLAIRPETILPVVQEALAGVFDESVRMHLHLNPSDEALVRGELGVRLAQSNCEIVADASIEAGGCRIETPRAEVDATLETRWRRTLAALGRAGEDGP